LRAGYLAPCREGAAIRPETDAAEVADGLKGLRSASSANQSAGAACAGLDELLENE